MKIFITTIAALSFSFNALAMHHEGAKDKMNEESGVAGQTMMVATEKSEIVWTGSKKFVDGEHTGTIKFKSGQVSIVEGVPVSGELTIDMTTIQNTDLEDDGYKKKLVGHLNSDDFFAVEKHETAKFVFSEVKSLGENQYALTGTMEIRGTKNQETIQATVEMNEDGTGFTATADAVIDRTKYGVEFNSESAEKSDDWFFVRWFKGTAGVAKDKIIKNDMNVSIKLVAEK